MMVASCDKGGDCGEQSTLFICVLICAMLLSSDTPKHPTMRVACYQPQSCTHCAMGAAVARGGGCCSGGGCSTSHDILSM